MYTSMFVDIVEEHRMQFEEIVLQSNSSVVAWIPFVFVLDRVIYFPIARIHDDYDNVCNNADNVEELIENDLVHRELSLRRLH